MKKIFFKLQFFVYITFTFVCFSTKIYAELFPYDPTGCASGGEICIQSGRKGINDEEWKSFGVSQDFLDQNPDWEIDPNWKTMDLGWDTTHSFLSYEYSSGTRTPANLTYNTAINDTTAVFMWDDDLTQNNQENGTTGSIDAYFRYDLDISGEFSHANRDNLKMAIAISADDDFELFVNGIPILKDDDFNFNTGEDLGPDHIHTFNYRKGKLQDRIPASGLFENDIVNIAIHATDGSLTDPIDYFQKRLLVDIKIGPHALIPEPSTLFLLLLGLVSLSIRPKYFKQKTGK